MTADYKIVFSIFKINVPSSPRIPTQRQLQTRTVRERNSHREKVHSTLASKVAKAPI